MEPLEHYTCHTLFDLDDRRNWDTMVQIISMRAQPVMLRIPKIVQADLNFYSFGSEHTGLHKIWSFEFGIEARGAFREGDNWVAGLMNDSVLVPMSTGLNETAQLEPACIITNSTLRNTYFIPETR